MIHLIFLALTNKPELLKDLKQLEELKGLENLRYLWYLVIPFLIPVVVVMLLHKYL